MLGEGDEGSDEGWQARGELEAHGDGFSPPGSSSPAQVQAPVLEVHDGRHAGTAP